MRGIGEVVRTCGQPCVWAEVAMRACGQQFSRLWWLESMGEVACVHVWVPPMSVLGVGREI
jgi:hypothetical protein